MGITPEQQAREVMANLRSLEDHLPDVIREMDRLRTEVARLRGLLREAQLYVDGYSPPSPRMLNRHAARDVSDRIDAALGGESEEPEPAPEEEPGEGGDDAE